MLRRRNGVLTAPVCLLLAVCLSGSGCKSMRPFGSVETTLCHVPRELQKTTLPRYVIEPPDILLIEVLNNLRPPDSPLRPADALLIQVAGTIPIDPLEDDEVSRQFKQLNQVLPIGVDGKVDLGPIYGTVQVAGGTLDQAREAIKQRLKQTLTNPQVSVSLPQPQGHQHIAGDHLVRPDGTVHLGIYSSVYVAGLTLDQAKIELERHLQRYILDPVVNVDVLGYNSKFYYVITDGGGAGEQVFPFPCTGNETILDAIGQINGLPAVASKKHIWLARPAPPELGYEQVLKVDWNAIARGGASGTNYQILPGDRVYVQADNLITLDTFVAKVISPFERIFGFVLLGNSTVRTIQFGHRGQQNGNGF